MPFFLCLHRVPTCHSSRHFLHSRVLLKSGGPSFPKMKARQSAAVQPPCARRTSPNDVHDMKPHPDNGKFLEYIQQLAKRQGGINHVMM